jgi:hypothetical protein
VRVPLGDDSREGIRTARVESSDGVTVYLVRCLPGGLWTCTCPDFEHRHRPCKHIGLARRRSMKDVEPGGDVL